MANALKCDRCGRYYDKNVKHRTAGRIYGGKIGGISTVDTDTSPDKWFDLCDDCITDLFKFMKGIDFVEVPQQESND